MDADLREKLRRGSQWHEQGQLDAAERLYRDVLASCPADTNALHFLGLLTAQKGDHETALALIEQAIAVAPDYAAAHYNRAAILCECGRLADALAGYDDVLRLQPGDAAVLNNRGAVLCALRRFDEALADYDSVLKRQPNDVRALSNSGNALLALERFKYALESYDRALTRDPANANAHYGRGNALKHLGRLAEALAAYERLLAIEPNHADAHMNRGELLLKENRHVDALAAYERAAAVSPARAIAHERCAAILFQLKRGEDALAAYDRAFAADPDLPYLEGARFLTKLYLCDWSNLDAERDRLIAHVRQGKPAANPFPFLSAAHSPADELVCARTYANRQYPAASEPLWQGERYDHPKIRLGFVSGEFREQATAYLVADLFECHDRSAFELHAFSTGRDDKSPMRVRIMAAFDSFSDASKQTDREIAAAIRACEIDILINLNGYFGEERTGLAAYRPAPLQVSYLGYPGTMGAPYIDYIMADRWVIPEDHRAHYAERVITLPHCYQANDRKKPRARTPLPKRRFALPERGFVFASFNNSYKITPAIFDIWMRLLRQVEGSVLWLLELDAAASLNIRAEAAKRGVDPVRIVFAPFLPQEDHLARIGHADLFLDSLPVNAHTTASDALWCGVPVLTAPGATFAGRVGASLLAALGLPELIAPSLDAYESVALELSRTPERLSEIRARLGANRDTHPLFDTPRLARSIEAAYRRIWQRQQNGLAPQDFAIPSET